LAVRSVVDFERPVLDFGVQWSLGQILNTALKENHMEKIGAFTFPTMDEASARKIVSWRYDPPYEMYNCDPNAIEETVQGFLNPHYHYYSVWDEAEELIGYRCFGEDGRIPGGDYRAAALDMGGGLRPDLTGQGRGAHFMEAAFAFARRHFAPVAFRATVASFNTRALRVCEQVGYRQVQTFVNTHTGQPFVVLMRDAGARYEGDHLFVVSGCSGSGKSTLIAALAQQGEAVVTEPGRQIVKEQIQLGGDGLPSTLQANVVEWTDLDLDYRVHPDHSVERLDQAEFEQNAQRMGYPPNLIEQVGAACREVEEGLAKRTFPFDYERQVELYRRIKTEQRPG